MLHCVLYTPVKSNNLTSPPGGALTRTKQASAAALSEEKRKARGDVIKYPREFLMKFAEVSVSKERPSSCPQVLVGFWGGRLTERET